MLFKEFHESRRKTMVQWCGKGFVYSGNIFYSATRINTSMVSRWVEGVEWLEILRIIWVFFKLPFAIVFFMKIFIGSLYYKHVYKYEQFCQINSITCNLCITVSRKSKLVKVAKFDIIIHWFLNPRKQHYIRHPILQHSSHGDPTVFFRLNFEI